MEDTRPAPCPPSRPTSGHAALYLGIAHDPKGLSLVSMMEGRPPIETTLAATAMSAEAVRIHIDDHAGPVGLAVDGTLIEFALACGGNTLVHTTLVATVPALSARELARYARHAR